MRMNRTKIFSIALASSLAILAAIAAPCLASAPGISYIQRDVSAAALGMGTAYSTSLDDSMVMHYNPAALYWLKKVEISASSSKDDFDRSNDCLNYTFAQGPKRKAYGGLSYVRDEVGGIEGRDNFGNLTGIFSDRQQIFAYGLGNSNRSLQKEGISYGVLAKALSHKVMGATGSGYGLDLGLMKNGKSGQRASLVVRNALGNFGWSGAGATRSEKPGRDMTVGYSLKCTKDGRLAAELMRDSSQDGKIVTLVGFEKKVSKMAVVRCGSRDGQLSYGLGFNLNQSRIDYAYAKNRDSDIQKVSGVFYFDD